MVKMFVIVLHVLAIVAGAVWVFGHHGSIEIHWADYDIRINAAFAFVAAVVAFFALYAVYRVLGVLLSFPRRWREGRVRRLRERGMKSLTIGLSAVAAGDGKMASYHAYRMRAAMPDEKGLTWLLEAQAARMRGDDLAAQGYFEKLLKDKDTSFLGVRGLLQTAIQNADLDRALSLAGQALNMHPDQPWILRTVFGLQTQKRDWDGALQTLKKADKAKEKTWALEEVKRNRVAILLQQADELSRAGYSTEAMRRLKEAQHIDPSFVPTAIRLAQAYIGDQKRRNAIAVIERAWKDNPHPDLVPVWEALSPHPKEKDPTIHLRWFERLVAIRPGDAESQIAAAQAAIQDGLTGEAWQYLSAAEKIKPNARLYRIWAQMEERTGHNESARRYWEKVAGAAADKVWTCTETGRIYERWSAIAEPHGAFNTIVWGYPSARRAEQALAPVLANDQIIEPVRQIAAQK